MAYGSFNAGSGASSYDLDMLAAEVISGYINASLTTADSVIITTQNGKQISAHTIHQEHERDDAALTSAIAGIIRMVDANRNEYFADKYTFASDVMRGIVSAPLTTANGNQIRLNGGEPLLAYRVKEDEKAYTDKTVAKAYTELSKNGEWYYAQNAAAIQALIADRYTRVADIIRGLISVPLMTADGNLICLSNGKLLFAYRVKEDEKSYTNKAIAKVVAEFYTTLDWYQAKNLIAMSTLAGDIIRGNVSAPLTTNNGDLIYIDDNKPLLAYKVEEDEKSYAKKEVAKAFAELSATVERYQAQNLAAMQSLITSLFSGDFTTPLANVDGTAVITDSGVDIQAVKNL